MGNKSSGSSSLLVILLPLPPPTLLVFRIINIIIIIQIGSLLVLALSRTLPLPLPLFTAAPVEAIQTGRYELISFLSRLILTPRVRWKMHDERRAKWKWRRPHLLIWFALLSLHRIFYPDFICFSSESLFIVIDSSWSLSRSSLFPSGLLPPPSPLNSWFCKPRLREN